MGQLKSKEVVFLADGAKHNWEIQCTNFPNSTGIRDVSLLSLSTTDYSQIKDLIRDVFRLSKVDNFDISLPLIHQFV